MSSGEEKPKFSVFEDVKNITVSPEALMAEINSAITSLEYTRAAYFLPNPQPHVSKAKTLRKRLIPPYDALKADEARNKTASAFTKLQSLVSLASQQLQKS